MSGQKPTLIRYAFTYIVQVGTSTYPPKRRDVGIDTYLLYCGFVVYFMSKTNKKMRNEESQYTKIKS